MKITFGPTVVMLLTCSLTQANEDTELMRRCLSDRVMEADDAVSVGDLRRECEQERSQPKDTAILASESPAKERGEIERREIGKPFTLLAHRPTYLLPYSYNAKVNDNQAVEDPERTEAGFQISFKFPVWRDAFGTGDNLFMSYTNRSFWQVYDQSASSPFRSTDHEPELFWRHLSDAAWGPVEFFGFDIGVSHQSNGRSRPLSRSWNRVVGTTVLSLDDFALGVRSWLRIPEDNDDDDNPDIEDYLGYGELRLIYAPNRNTFTLMTRAAQKGGAVELTWSHQLTSAVRLYAQYFNGFGETLIDYDHRVERISLGIALNDYLINGE